MIGTHLYVRIYVCMCAHDNYGHRQPLFCIVLNAIMKAVILFEEKNKNNN